MYSLIILSHPLHIRLTLAPATIINSEPPLHIRLSSFLTDFLHIPGWPPLTACPAFRPLRYFPAQPVRLVVTGSGGGWGGILVGDGKLPDDLGVPRQ